MAQNSTERRLIMLKTCISIGRFRTLDVREMLKLIDHSQRFVLDKELKNKNDNLINKYNAAAPLIGRLAREIQQMNDIINDSVRFIDDLNVIKNGLYYHL